MTTLQDCRALDAQDPLRELRQLFALPEGVIYLDGNSLGVLPRATPQRVAEVVQREWGEGLIRSWNTAGWFELPQRVGDKIAGLIGARPGEVVATDSTSVNLFKVLSAAILIAREDHPARTCVLSERSNFPTDLYIAQALCRQHGLTLRLVEPEEIAGALTPEVAVLMLTHVNYRTGAMHDMAAVTAAAHAAGVLTVWDLAHSAGAVPVDLHGADADFSVGCGYKYLNGGPGAPAFVWVHPRHADRFWQPLAGWWGHAAPFEFTPDYRPAPGIARYLCGTQPIMSLAALDCGLDTLLAAAPLGGMAALRSKSLALADLFIRLVEERCAGHGLGLATPRDPARRGSQACLTREPGAGVDGAGSGAYAIVQTLIARGVIGDFRAGDGGRHKDILRFGFTPLYIGFEDMWHAVEHLRQVLETGEWRQPEFNQQQAVT
ncbi:kynureninase [Variovorax terrae]|uniref:Kynureninase n=1 Tax=Variovorax terrae TaxID=2923278 RepID=A0A9X1VUQ9_9BURK|nr:kynureninase [Variovorax terrae]MCJ0764216.1 kynureninase [Variovorax terrae]